MNESLRAEYWLKCWIATANSDNCTSTDICTAYADRMLAAYDKRFKANPDNHIKNDKEE